MQEITTYKVTLKPTSEEGTEAEGMHHIAYVDDPAMEQIGVYLNKVDTRIVADDEIQAKILEHLKSCGQTQPEHWREVDESEYLEALNIELTNDPLARSSFNDFPNPKGGGQWLVRYRYTGPRDNRNREFCAQILGLDRIYTEEEIKNGLSNPEFGNYSIFDYKGSYGCRHVWKRLIFYEDYEDDEVRRVGNVPRVVAQLDDSDATTLNAFLSKDEKMQVCAPLLIPDKIIPRVDKGKAFNIQFDAEVIRDIRDLAHSRNIISRTDLFKNTHGGEIAPSHVVEDWIIEDENDKAYTFYGFDQKAVPVGSWIVLSQVTDREFWENEIKAKRKYAYSIEAFINLTNINLSKMEEQKRLPDGEHTIAGKVYTVTDGVVTEIRDVELEAVEETVELETVMETVEPAPVEMTEETPAVEPTPAPVEMQEEAPAAEYVTQEQFQALVSELAALRAIVEMPPPSDVEVQMSQQPKPLPKWKVAAKLVKTK